MAAVGDLVLQGLDIEPGARASFLEQNCTGDTELRKEVEALLDEAGKPMDLLEQPVLEAAHGVVTESERVLNPGTTIGHYQIISLLSKGGMGQVYPAEDTSLQRKVAFKVLAPGFIHDDRGLSRFQREARAASTLNHPNIVTIYEFGEIEARTLLRRNSWKGLRCVRSYRTADSI